MAKERLSMRKLKEVLRLKFETDLSNRQIAKSCSTSHVTVGKYLALAEQAALSWPLPENLDDAQSVLIHVFSYFFLNHNAANNRLTKDAERSGAAFASPS